MPNFDKYKNIDSKLPLHIYEIGTSDIKANNNSTKHSILPGAYKDLMLKWNDTLNLTGGNYYFNNIDASDSAIKMQLDLSKGAINIYA